MDTSDFAQKVRQYNQLPPFSFSSSQFKKFKIHVPIYAAHLYDSVILYARALDSVIKARREEGSNSTGALDIGQLARDGKTA